MRPIYKSIIEHLFFKLGYNFFRSDPASLWRTVACDFAKFDPSFATNLVEILKERKVNPEIPDMAMHFQYLIEEPLMKTCDHFSSHAIPVVVINALDECGSEGSQTAQQKALVDTLTQWSHLSKMFKLIIMGCNERTVGNKTIPMFLYLVKIHSYLGE